MFLVDYKDYNDYELLYLICEQNEDAYEILYKKYRPVVEIKAKKYYRYACNKGLDYNDLVQEGLIGLSEAIRDFKINKNVRFSTFANLCIDRQISTALLGANRKKHKILNESLSLNEAYANNDTVLMDFIDDKGENDPSNYIIQVEAESETYNRIKQELTEFEKQVFDLKVKGFDYKEISTLLGKSYKSIDCAIQRIKSKFRKILNR
jgi:RNA polymerase sporulation-specific sigma factor